MDAASPWLPFWPHPGAHYVQRIHLLSLAAHAVVALGLSAVLSWKSALAGTTAIWLVLALRLRLLVEERPRSRVAVKLVDEPLFWHWGNCVLGLLVMPLTVALLHFSGWSPLEMLGLHASRADRSVAEAGLLAYVAAAPVSAWGIWGIRRRLRVRRVEVVVPGLPAAFDGYRVVHLSDLHIGGFDPKARGFGWAERANACRPDLCVVTGDFVTSGSGFYADAAEVVGSLRAPDGVFACMGNHDQTDNDMLTSLLEARGVHVLRNQWQGVRRGAAELVVAGLDDRYTGTADLDRTLSGRPSDAPTILLAHDPYIGEAAAERGVQLILSGHTHGGQVGIPWIADFVNLTMLMRQPRSGLHEIGPTQHYISAGLGTTGPPLRLGVTPEIGLLVLRSRPGNMATP